MHASLVLSYYLPNDLMQLIGGGNIGGVKIMPTKITIKETMLLSELFVYGSNLVIMTLNGTASKHDTNKVRVSALENPLYFDAANVYSLDGDVLGFCSNSLPISQGQFGQHPMFVFTTKGIYAMQIGTNNVVIESIVPVNGIICTDGKSNSINANNFSMNVD